MAPTRLKRYSHSFPARLRPIVPCATNAGEGTGTGPGGPPSLQSIRRHSYVVNDGSLSPTDMRVLLVEDNLVNQKVALKLLARLGYSNVRVANDGRQAVDIIAASASATGQAGYDVVIMDLHMPEMDGITASRIIKRTARSAGSAPPYIIACTADLQYDTRQACIQAGLDGYLEKPIKLKDLSRAMMEAHAAVYP
jgi:CheY-like chemotaxis protein